MKGKTLLFLSADHFHACTWEHGALSAARHFAGDADGRAQFAEFLQAHPAPAYLLTDLIEEDFRLETVPHLRGAEHRALIRRKLEQHYRNTPFRQALMLQRRKDGRRDDELLFSSLTNPALISPWLGVMQEHGTALVGIYSVPCISAPLVKDLPCEHLLLLSWEKLAGLRQTYFDCGLLRFSRLTPVNDSDSFSAAAATESLRTQQYLKNLSLLTHGQVLNVAIICHADDRPELEKYLSDDTDMHYAYLDIRELGQRIKSKADYADSDATLLFLHLLATQPPRSHYAAAEHTHFLRLSKIRSRLHVLSTSIAAACLLWVTVNIWHAQVMHNENNSIKAQASSLSQQTQLITLDFPNTSISATDMKTAVQLSRKLDGYSPPPQLMLDALSKTLGDFPRIRIDKLSWDASTASPGEQNILLGGELTEFSGDFRSALNYLNRFQQVLTQRGYRVSVLTLPLDISPNGSIAADAIESNDKPALFSLKIIWGLAA